MTDVIVCGGRDFYDYKLLDECLSDLHADINITRLIHGDANGADKLAGQWAKYFHIETIAVPAKWGQYGSAAGAIRNAIMLDLYSPYMVIAFKGGKGTANMIKLAEANGTTVREMT